MDLWDPAFFRKSPLFWPIARAAAAFESFADWPEPRDLARAFVGEPPVRFELAAPKTPYDARIALDGVVPTRARSWHDFLNALAWATFPRAKRALHARQHRMIAARRGEDARLPNARTKEQDAVAMLDEGGVALVCGGDAAEEVSRRIAGRAGDVSGIVARGGARVVIFGHAIHEHLARGARTGVRGAARVAIVDEAATRDDDGPAVAAADQALSALFTRAEPVSRADFGAVAIDGRLERALFPRADKP
jgi:hypothetical protein